jgi:hypothetical protein
MVFGMWYHVVQYTDTNNSEEPVLLNSQDKRNKTTWGHTPGD